MKNVLVTGASRGIGRAIALSLAKRGARVALHYGSDQAAAEETRRAMAGDGHVSLRADLTDISALEPLWQAATHALGKVDALINKRWRFSRPSTPDNGHDGLHHRRERRILFAELASNTFQLRRSKAETGCQIRSWHAGSYLKGAKTQRSSSRTADQNRASDQHEDGEGAGDRHPAVHPVAGEPGDRVVRRETGKE
ncbi:MAG: SDR family NAD(P)-dependent oxidoreductase [Tardiphaga sp.]